MLLIAVGNKYRRDDGVALEVAGRVRALRLPDVEVIECAGDVMSLVDRWAGRDLVVIVDAVASGECPGTLHRRDLLTSPLPRHWFAASSHQLGLADGVELGRIMQRLPHAMLFIGVEGDDFNDGIGLSPEVERAVPIVIEILRSQNSRPLPTPSGSPSSCPRSSNSRSGPAAGS